MKSGRKEKESIVPPNIPEGMKVLDVGCGTGQVLIEHYGDQCSFGIDIDFSALTLAKTQTDKVVFVCGRAEALPFQDASFEFVIARVSLPYTNIATSLHEISRVMKTDGQLWAVLERLSLPFWTGLYKKPRFYVFLPYLLFNTLVFRIFSKSIPFVDGKYRGYQTVVGLKRALKSAGFADIHVTKGLHLVTTARRSRTASL
jgi:ubiquinone/menaquinone biosynthesis C-methylase UbiE